MEKQREKFARRKERKLAAKQAPDSDSAPAAELTDSSPQ